VVWSRGTRGEGVVDSPLYSLGGAIACLGAALFSVPAWSFTEADHTLADAVRGADRIVEGRYPTGGNYLIPLSTPDGDYWVCAGINPDQTESEAESSFIDNTVISEAKWTIDCP
jgi:hypothetical protein